jgi:hypothetical protein
MKRAIVLLLIAVPAFAQAQRESCPLLLPEGAIAVTRPPAGWTPGPRTLVRLSGAGVMSGKPERMGYLIPSEGRKIKGGHVTSYIFDAGEEKWLWCEYGTSATQIAKRMNDAATACEVTTKEERRGVYTEVTAACK